MKPILTSKHMSALARDEAKARRQGLSYGQYKARPVVVRSHAPSAPSEAAAERDEGEQKRKGDGL